MFLSALGKLPSGKRLKKIEASLNYRDGAFKNLSETRMFAKGNSFFSTFRDFLSKPKDAYPAGEIPTIKTNLKGLCAGPALVWFGHSSYLIKINNLTILVDPVLSGNASPFSFMVRSFKGADVYTADDLPEIDILLLTHDHYDHLDHRLIVKLKNKVKKVVCSLGVGAHLEYWGYDASVINELDWCDKIVIDDITLTAAPARHFSGRVLKRNQSLWSSFILKANDVNIYIGGDSGYDSHFKKIGAQYGPFDLAILECGQYYKAWPLIHMSPEETAQAAIDLNAKVLLPVHWGKFSLALHTWTDPITRLLKEAEKPKVEVATPLIGEVYEIGAALPKKKWWEKLQ
jgi:L-ascorbate metabolism protein UlaG (beta-lactamase superfamily)